MDFSEDQARAYARIGSALRDAGVDIAAGTTLPEAGSRRRRWR